MINEPGLHGALQDGRQDEQAPDAVDNARHRGQQFNRHADRPAQPARTGLRQEHRNAEAQRDRNQQRDQGSRDRAVNGSPCTKNFGDRVPVLAGHERPLEGRQGRPAAVHQRKDDAGEQYQYEDCRELGGNAKHAFGARLTLQMRSQCQRLGVHAFPAETGRRPAPRAPAACFNIL